MGCYPNRLILKAKHNTAMRVIAHTTGGDGTPGGCITRVSVGTRSGGEGCEPLERRKAPCLTRFCGLANAHPIPPPNPLLFPNFPAPTAEAP